MPNNWALFGYWDATEGGGEFLLPRGRSADECFSALPGALSLINMVKRSRIAEVWLKRWIGDKDAGYWQYVRKVDIGREIRRINKRDYDTRRRRNQVA